MSTIKHTDIPHSKDDDGGGVEPLSSPPSPAIICLLVFTLALVLFLWYLVAVNAAIAPPVYAYWTLIAILTVCLVWQSDRVGRNGYHEGIILAEIAVFAFALHLIFVIPVSQGLFGRDVHSDYYATKTILEYGWPIPNSVEVLTHTREYSLWPGMHILGGVVSRILCSQ
jgi:hypothetical protein